MAVDQLSKDAYKKRLRALRALHDNKSQKEFAEHLGIPYTRWSEYEGKGYPLPREACYLIFAKFGEGFIEWLWFGAKTHLPEDFRRDLERWESETAKQERSASKDLHEHNKRFQSLFRKRNRTDKKRDSKTV